MELMTKQSPLFNRIMDERNIYSAIYSMESYVNDKGLLNTEKSVILDKESQTGEVVAISDLELYSALYDKHNVFLIDRVIQNCRQRLEKILFDKNELLARIHAVVRRSKGHSESIIVTGDVVVNLDTQTVTVCGKSLHLTGKEYGIMELLSLRKGSTLNKDQFLNHLYGGIDEPELKIIDVFICKLRKKLEKASGGKNYIETVWGRGYVLRDPDEQKK